MEFFSEEILAGIPDARQFARTIVRLLAAIILGAMIGLQRERIGKPAGLRTHILVALGTTTAVMACIGFGMNTDGLSRVIQGIVTGIGFIGAGSILKLSEQRDVQGLTTAAGVWMTAAVGVAVGLGALGLAVIGTILTLIVLAFVGRIEFQRLKRRESNVENEKFKMKNAK
jgi:putative Mg2+ transporter-C (MgtC) family protein